MQITNAILIPLSFLSFALPASTAPFMDYLGPVKGIPKSASMSNRIPVSLIKINPASVNLGSSNRMELGGKTELDIRLTPDLEWKVAITGFQSTGKESWAASGPLGGNSSGYASIGYSNGTYVLNVVDLSRNESYGVMPIGGGAHLSFRQVPGDRPFCDHKASRKTPVFSRPSLARKFAAVSGDDSLIVDMAFYWSSDAADVLGGDDAVKAHINRNVLDLNEALKRSQGKGHWRVSLAQRIDHSRIEGAPSVLEYAGRSSIRVYDSLVAETCLRGLDYTQIILAKGFPPDIAGINRASLTFVEANAMGRTTTVHEAGHSLGCSHERTAYPDRGASRSQYAFGFDGVDSLGTPLRCSMYHEDGNRIPYFSNPTLTVRGTKIGIPIGTLDSLGRNNSADCAEQIRSLDGAETLSSYSRIGLTVGGFKKYGAILPGGVQEYWLKIGNISGQELPITEVGIHKNAADSLVFSDPPGTLLGKTYIIWNNLGRVPPGEFLKPTYSERVIRFQIRPGPGRNEIGELSYAIDNTGFMNQELISPTPVDPNAGISLDKNIPRSRKIGFQTGFSRSRFIDLAQSSKSIVVYNLNGSSLTIYQAPSEAISKLPAFGWKAFKEIIE